MAHDLLNHICRVLNEFPFVLPTHGLLQAPALSVTGRYMAAINNIFLQCGLPLRNFADSVRCDLDVMLSP